MGEKLISPPPHTTQRTSAPPIAPGFFLFSAIIDFYRRRGSVCVFSGGGGRFGFGSCSVAPRCPRKRRESELHFHPWLRGNQRPHRRTTSRGKKADPRGHKSISSHDGTGILMFTNFPSRKLQKIVERTPTKPDRVLD